ncbi:type II toxin-antitoxin system RelE/ParE family toxin [uncultured Brevundimonas sp.]|uniref:type II toxin-antitoxin system RelE/ParE family toxin n=1 Tax=uncultured Brevundimonas sp. TaxID=213418 RepID=UPI0030EB8974
MKVRLTSRAHLDLRLQIDWLTDRSPRSARKAVRAIFDTISRLTSHPLSGHATPGDEREAQVRFGQFGFVIRYEVRQNEVIIVRVFHGAQDRS